MWQDLGAAIALLLVLEGLLPFISPDSLRRVMLKMAQQDDRSLRSSGLVSMVLGVVLLYLVK